MNRCFEELLLQIIGNEKVVRYIQNPGNLGDSLISLWLYSFFRENSICVHFGAEKIRSGDVVLYSGGGNLVSLYNDTSSVIECCMIRNINKFILLPHTVNSHEKLIEKMDGRFHIFVREKMSYDYLSERRNSFNLYMANDMALLLTDEQVNESIKKRNHYFFKILTDEKLRIGKKVRLIKAYIKMIGILIENKFGRLHTFYRIDAESSKGNVSKRKWSMNVDLSGFYDSDFSSEEELRACAGAFLWFLSKYSGFVKTDRLHVAVACHLLKKKCNLSDNSYGKNEAVFNHSLSDSPYIEFAGH